MDLFCPHTFLIHGGTQELKLYLFWNFFFYSIIYLTYAHMHICTVRDQRILPNMSNYMPEFLVPLSACIATDAGALGHILYSRW